MIQVSVQIDLNRFREIYFGNVKYEKEINNVIDDVFFDILLNQVMSS